MKNNLVFLSNSGSTIRSDDEYELKNSILRLKEDKEFYDNYCNNGRTFVENNFMEEVIQKKLKNIMDGL